MKLKLRKPLKSAIKPILIISIIGLFFFFLSKRFEYSVIYAPPFYEYPTYYLHQISKPEKICKSKKFKKMIDDIILQKYFDPELAELRQMSFPIIFFNRKMRMIKTRQYGVYPYISVSVKITSPYKAEVTVFYRDKKDKNQMVYTELIDYTGRIPPLSHEINSNASYKMDKSFSIYLNVQTDCEYMKGVIEEAISLSSKINRNFDTIKVITIDNSELLFLRFGSSGLRRIDVNDHFKCINTLRAE